MWLPNDRFGPFWQSPPRNPPPLLRAWLPMLFDDCNIFLNNDLMSCSHVTHYTILTNFPGFLRLGAKVAYTGDR